MHRPSLDAPSARAATRGVAPPLARINRTGRLLSRGPSRRPAVRIDGDAPGPPGWLRQAVLYLGAYAVYGASRWLVIGAAAPGETAGVRT